MDSALKQRLIGAAVLVALAMIFLPMLLQDREEARDDVSQVPLDIPAAPDSDFETRELPLAVPQAPGEGEAVLGMDAPVADPADPNAVVTVEPTGDAAPRTDFETAADAAPGDVAQAVDAATGQPLPAPAATAPAPAEPVASAPAPAATPEPAAATAPAPAELVASAPTPAPTATPEPAPAPAQPLPASAAGGRWAVNAGSYSNLDNARALSQRLKAQGLPVTAETVDVNGKPAMRLRVGPYAERTLAEAARLRVESVTGGSAAVVALDGGAAAPAPARPGAAPNVGFAVQLGALSSEADANALRDRARAAGFTAFHQRIATERGVVWRVRVGPEADRAAAERLKAQVGEKLGLREAIIVSHP